MTTPFPSGCGTARPPIIRCALATHHLRLFFGVGGHREEGTSLNASWSTRPTRAGCTDSQETRRATRKTLNDINQRCLKMMDGESSADQVGAELRGIADQLLNVFKNYPDSVFFQALVGGPMEQPQACTLATAYPHWLPRWISSPAPLWHVTESRTVVIAVGLRPAVCSFLSYRRSRERPKPIPAA